MPEYIHPEWQFCDGPPGRVWVEDRLNPHIRVGLIQIGEITEESLKGLVRCVDCQDQPVIGDTKIHDRWHNA